MDFHFLRSLLDLSEIVDEIGRWEMVDERVRFEESVSGYIGRFMQG